MHTPPDFRVAASPSEIGRALQNQTEALIPPPADDAYNRIARFGDCVLHQGDAFVVRLTWGEMDCIVADWVAKFTDLGETMLDPFMVSGTIGVACAMQGRKFVGIEMPPDYFELACRRLADFDAQGVLFTSAEEPVP